jgi:NADH-quinone oxidoreductase subunit A
MPQTADMAIGVGSHSFVPLLASTDLSSYLPLALVILMAVTFAVANLVLTSVIGPNRPGGKIKGQTYESGMEPIGTARKRFNVRFYLIAMVFLVFDVEIIFLYPWASTFPNTAPMTEESLTWLIRILFFLLTTVVAYVYGFRKGVFKFD